MDEPIKKVRGHRRKHVPPLRKRLISLTDAQAALLRKWGRGDVSAGLRWLITAAEPLILRTTELENIINTQQQDGKT